MSADAAAMAEGVLRRTYRETARLDREVHAVRDEIRLQMYALHVSNALEQSAIPAVSGQGKDPAEVLGPFRRH